MRERCSKCDQLLPPGEAVSTASDRSPRETGEGDCECNPRCALGCVPGCPACKKPRPLTPAERVLDALTMKFTYPQGRVDTRIWAYQATSRWAILAAINRALRPGKGAGE